MFYFSREGFHPEIRMATLTAEDGGSIMIKEAIIKLSKKEDLSYEMAQTVMDEIMTGERSSGNSRPEEVSIIRFFPV